MEVLDELVARNPPFFEGPVAAINENIKSRHWYELGLALTDLLQLEAVVGERKMIYEKGINYYEKFLDPVQLAKIIHLVSQEFTAPTAAIQFLEAAIPKLESSANAKQWIKLQIVAQLIINGEFEAALSDLTAIEPTIDQSTDLAVRSLFYKVQSSLDKARGDYDSFYKYTLLYLSTSRQSGDMVLAYDLCQAALCAKDVFSFGELAGHNVIQSLKGSENEWLMDLIMLMERGSPSSIEEFNSRYVHILSSRPLFSAFLEIISRKVKLCVLQELIFQRPFESRVFAFDEVSRVCCVPKDEVELLVLKALSAGLIRGFINEVDEIFVVTWCKTKTLSIPRLSHLKEEIDRWIKKVHDQKIRLEERAQLVVG
jgi:26S proteasome regulatory subunit N9